MTKTAPKHANDYPKMLYKSGGITKLQDGDYTVLVVDGEDAHDAALKEGFFDTSPEAKEHAEAAKKAADKKAAKA